MVVLTDATADHDTTGVKLWFADMDEIAECLSKFTTTKRPASPDSTSIVFGPLTFATVVLLGPAVLWRMPTPFLELLRIVVTLTCGVLAAWSWERCNTGRRLLVPGSLIAVAVVFNPIMPFALGERWRLASFVAVASLIAAWTTVHRSFRAGTQR